MPIEHEGWRLYSRTVGLNPRLQKTTYFFSREGSRDGEPADPPDGFRIAARSDSDKPFLERLAKLVD